MKRIAIALALCLSIFAQAQDTITLEDTGGFISKLVYDWTSDGAGAATGRTTAVVPGILFGVATTPDTTNVPTDLYDVVVKQAFTNTSAGVTVLAADLTAGAVANRSSTVVQWTDFWPTSILTSGGFIQIEVTNAGASKEGRIEFYVYRTLAIIPEGGNGIPLGGVTTQLLQNSGNGVAKWITMSGDATIVDGGNLQLVDPLLIEGLTMTGILIAGTAPTTLTNADGTLKLSALENGLADLLGTANEVTIASGTGVLVGGTDATVSLPDTVDIGVSDTTLGTLRLFGPSGTTNGGTLQIFNAADDDTTVDFWKLTTNVDFELTDNAGAVAMRIDDTTLDVKLGSNLIVGSPTATPEGTLHVFTATAGSVTADSFADDFILENSGSGGLSILVPDGSNSNLYFGSPTDNIGAQMVWNHTTGSFVVGSQVAGASLDLRSGDGTTAILIDSSQKATLAGDLVVEGTGSSSVAGLLGVGGGGAATPDTVLHVEQDIDNSANWWSANASSAFIDNVHVTGDGILKFGGVDGRIVFGPNSAAAEFKISSRHSAGDTAEDTVWDNNGAMAVPNLTVEDDLVVTDDFSVNGITDFTNSPSVTLATGSATPTATYQELRAEGGAADDCDTLVATVTGQFIIIRAFDSTDTITMKDGTGNLNLAGDFALDNSTDTITLIFNGINWDEISRSNNGA